MSEHLIVDGHRDLAEKVTRFVFARTRLGVR